MKRYVVVATLRRGELDEPELLDGANQWLALESADASLARDIVTLRQRATRVYQAERDPAMSAREMDALTRGGRKPKRLAQRVDELMALAKRAG